MATAVSTSAWSKPGAWALDSEEQEAIEALQSPPQQKQQLPTDSFEFPSLSDAASAKPSRKKKPHQTLSLAEFTTGRQVSHGSAKAGLTHDEVLLLPTGPRHRTPEELDRSNSRLGGGFHSYGARDDSGPRSRWGSSSSSPRVSNDEPRQRPGFNRDSAPSRADEIDDWGASKKSAPPRAADRRERGGFFDSQSRADESDNWVSNKSSIPSESRRIGGGFEGYKEKRGGFDTLQKEVANGGADSDSWGKKKEEGSGRPRLTLQPRKLPVSNGEQQQQQQEQPGSVTTRSKGSNPFGEARPREEVLAEKGHDWKKIDEQFDSMKIKEVGSTTPMPGEGPSFGKKSFVAGNGRASLSDDRTERTWRKADPAADVSPRSETVNNGEAQN